MLSLQDALRHSTHPSIRWHHCKILCPTCKFIQMQLWEPDFFGSWVMHSWRDASCHFETPTWFFYVEIYKQKWCWKGLLIALLEESREEYLQASLKADSALTCCHEKKPQEPWRTKRPQERDVERSAPTRARHTHCAVRQLGITADQRYDIPRDWLWERAIWQGSVEEPAATES